MLTPGNIMGAVGPEDDEPGIVVAIATMKNATNWLVSRISTKCMALPEYSAGGSARSEGTLHFRSGEIYACETVIPNASWCNASYSAKTSEGSPDAIRI
jgi:hypothetical protein